MKKKILYFIIALLMPMAIYAQTSATPYQKKVAQITLKYYKIFAQGSGDKRFNFFGYSDPEIASHGLGLAYLEYSTKRGAAAARRLRNSMNAELKAAEKLKNSTDRLRESQAADKAASDENEQIENNNTSNNDENIYSMAEEMPHFNGNVNSWIAQHLQYPATAAKNGIQGRVVVKFAVGKDGSLSHVSVVRSVDPDLDKEAVRLVENMPKWSPGIVDGEPASIWYTLPVTFKLQ